jgi:hypothetical protein
MHIAITHQGEMRIDPLCRERRGEQFIQKLLAHPIRSFGRIGLIPPARELSADAQARISSRAIIGA